MFQAGTLAVCTTECDCQVLVPCQSTFCLHRGWRRTTCTVTCWCSGDSSSTMTSTSCQQRSRTPGSVTVGTVMRRVKRAVHASQYQSVLTTRGFTVVDASDLFAPAPCVAGTISAVARCVVRHFSVVILLLRREWAVGTRRQIGVHCAHGSMHCS